MFHMRREGVLELILETKFFQEVRLLLASYDELWLGRYGIVRYWRM